MAEGIWIENICAHFFDLRIQGNRVHSWCQTTRDPAGAGEPTYPGIT